MSSFHQSLLGKIIAVLLYSLTFALIPSKLLADQAKRLNGFLIEQPLIPSNEIKHGGPPRDGIPAIDQPEFTSASSTSLSPTDKVLGVSINGIAKAYPINILNYHELVNDTFEGASVTISFCPLCGTGVVFNSSEGRTFGVSGLLYNSDLLMYDRETESLWSQIEGRAISGPDKGKELDRLPVEHTIWADWHSRHPTTLVLSEDTGHWRDYQRTPYPGYDKNQRLYFPVNNTDKRYKNKDLVLGIEIDGHFKAYPFKELEKTSGRFEDTLNGQKITLIYNHTAKSARAENKKGKPITTLTSYWFAWIAFHPESHVYVFNPE